MKGCCLNIQRLIHAYTHILYIHVYIHVCVCESLNICACKNPFYSFSKACAFRFLRDSTNFLSLKHFRFWYMVFSWWIAIYPWRRLSRLFVNDRAHVTLTANSDNNENFKIIFQKSFYLVNIREKFKHLFTALIFSLAFLSLSPFRFLSICVSPHTYSWIAKRYIQRYQEYISNPISPMRLNSTNITCNVHKFAELCKGI